MVNLKNVECPHEVKTVALNLGQLEKGGYPHFMLKEIFEQPDCIHDCMRGRINLEGTNVVLSAIIDYKERLLGCQTFCNCGLWHVVARCAYRQTSDREFLPHSGGSGVCFGISLPDPVIDSSDVVIAISQSGETADTLAAIELAKSRGAFIIWHL